MRFDRTTRRTASRGHRLLPAVVVLLLVVSGCGGAGGPDAPAPSKEAARTTTPAPQPSWNTEPASIAALGDSITTGFHACEPLSDCPEASWATGTDPRVDSLARRLLDHPRGRAYNHAVAGAVVADLPAQAAKAAADEPELATILIGANDACTNTPEAMTSVEQFQKHLRASVRALRQGSPRTQILMASVPDLARMFEVGKRHKAARDVWQLGICQSLLRAPLSTSAADQDRRKQVEQRVLEYNDVLKEVCAADKLCRYDGGVVHGYSFTEAELSEWDWFHPSKRGQQVLARVLHRTLTARG